MLSVNCSSDGCDSLLCLFLGRVWEKLGDSERDFGLTHRMSDPSWGFCDRSLLAAALAGCDSRGRHGEGAAHGPVREDAER